MKKIVSISLGSSHRDHQASVEMLGETFDIRRIGTDGDFRKAASLLQEFDGQVDVIGLGGIDIFLYAGRKKFPLRDGVRLMQLARKTPVVDGSGLKNSLEREVVAYLNDHEFSIRGKKVLMVSALDRYGMAEAFWEHGGEMVFGDFIFALGLDKPLLSLEELQEQAEKLLPEIGKLPIGFLYPIGKKQNEQPADAHKFFHYYEEADIIAGDFHFIRKYLPPRIPGKIIVTNTVTPADVQRFRECGASLLVTTTPEFSGRSFGTNVLEAVLLALTGKTWEEVKLHDYINLLRELNLRPRIEHLNHPKSTFSSPSV